MTFYSFKNHYIICPVFWKIPRRFVSVHNSYFTAMGEPSQQLVHYKCLNVCVHVFCTTIISCIFIMFHLYLMCNIKSTSGKLKGICGLFQSYSKNCIKLQNWIMSVPFCYTLHGFLSYFFAFLWFLNCWLYKMCALNHSVQRIPFPFLNTHS